MYVHNEKDGMGIGMLIYHVDKVVLETGKYLGDGIHIVYVNGAYCGYHLIGNLMHDLSCENPSDMFYSKLAKQVRFFQGR